MSRKEGGFLRRNKAPLKPFSQFSVAGLFGLKKTATLFRRQLFIEHLLGVRDCLGPGMEHGKIKQMKSPLLLDS